MFWWFFRGPTVMTSIVGVGIGPTAPAKAAPAGDAVAGTTLAGAAVVTETAAAGAALTSATVGTTGRSSRC